MTDPRPGPRPNPIGIDLGTTHSLVAYVDERNRPRVLEVEAGSALLPSAVHYRADGGVEVGAAALRAAGARPEDTILSVKRLMGRAGGDLRPEDRGVYRYDEAGDALRLRVGAGPGGAGARAVTPVEVSAEILRALRRAAAPRLGPPGACVVTVPAYFDDAQRQATRDAGRLAGLDVVRLLNEPTAAALAYGLDQRVRGRYAVYDLGGGTFDVSILALEDGVFEVLATGGDTHLGGDDLDRAVVAWLVGQGAAGDGPAALRALTSAARRLREALSSREVAEVELAAPPGARPGHGGPRRARLTRPELEALLAPVVERTTAACRQALRDAGLEGRGVDGVVLAGGATRTPLVRRHVRALFGREPFDGVDPDTVVALGAAVHAEALDRGGRDDLLLLDVTPLSLGVEMMGGVVERLVPRNSKVPTSASQQFTTYADGQTGLVVHVVQGERELARDCRSLARFTLQGIPPMPAGMARVELTYAVDADGILSVSARELRTGLEQRVQVKATYGLSEDEVERMLVESFERGAEDVGARLLAEWRVEAERLVRALEEALAEDGDLLSPPERVHLDQKLAGLRGALRGGDGLALQAWIASTDEAAQRLVERRVDRHIARALRGQAVDELAATGRPKGG